MVYDERFDFFNGGSTSWAAATLTDIVIEEKMKGVQWEGVFKDAKILMDFIKTGVSVWEYFGDVDERSLERDKFLNMILFYDSFSNALYSNDGFFGLLLDDPSETSYQTLVNGIQMYLVAEDMILDYAVDYSVMLKRALEDWKKSTFSLVDVSLYVKDVYRARYPDRSTSGRTVNSC